MSQVALTTLKNTIKTTLDDANTTTGSPIDLSANMSSRVKKVLQINPERIPIQPSFFPYITMFYDAKTVELQDIAGSLSVGRRRATIDLSIVGAVWIDNMSASNFDIKDLADNECETLMENIEEILRSNPALGGNALWSKTMAVTYHNFSVSESSHFRAGIMTHRITVQY